MDEKQKTELVNILGKSVSFDAAMSSYSAYRVGGNAEAACSVNDLKELENLLAFFDSENIPWMVVGKGSNLLVTDKGIKGAVIVLKGKLADVCEGEGNTLIAGGGLSIAGFLKSCVQKELAGMEFMAGIPGTIGGAVVMNAGAYGQEIGKKIESIKIIDDRGRLAELDGSQISFSYRKALLPEKAIVYSASLKLEKDKPELIRERIESNIKKRKESQPLDMPNCGSVFKNPPNNFAGKLIEESGLKGKTIGGAMVSPKHANFIVNRGDAKASDILELIDFVKRRVKADSDIDLETEIRVTGL